MNNLLKAALVPAFTMLAEQARSSLSTQNGGYAGIDLTAGKPFAGMQGRVKPSGRPVQFNPSVEGALSGDADRQQFNADVLFDPAQAPIAPYAGVGLCAVRGPADDTSFGLNLVGGANLDLGPVDSFVQLRLTVADGVHLSLTGGAFPGSG